MAEGVLMDRSRMNPRRASSLAVNDVADSGGGGVMMRTRHISLNSYSSLAGGAGPGAGAGYMSYGSPQHQQQEAPPPSAYASLPASFYNDQKLTIPSPPLPIHQPPLLPLPLASKSSPKLTRTISGNGTFRSREHRPMKPTKPSTNSVPRNAAAAAGSQARERPKAVEKLMIASGKDEEEELVSTESIYSLSPPPSNLPLPTFLLTGHKAGGGAAGGY